MDRVIHPGTILTIGKAGSIIPKILSVENTDKLKFFIPLTCPICNSKLILKDKHLICNSPNCLVQISKSIAYFYSDKGMDVKTIGELIAKSIKAQIGESDKGEEKELSEFVKK